MLNSNELSNFRKPKVIWKSDSNTLYVVATRQQHMWVEGYLNAADKPQPLIALEVKFIETSRDPKREFGIDWGGTFEQGTFNQVKDVSETTDDKGTTTTVEFEQVATNGGYRTDLSNLWTDANFNKAGAALGWPALGILSAQDINVKLRAMLRDEETQTTSYPRMVTLNNREVTIRSVLNQPVLGGSASSSLGSGSTTTQSISYLPIGTVLNILPKRMDGDKILLNMAVTVSSIVGTEVIGGNPFPIASSRVYSAPVEIESGYTVAVGGLDEAREREGKAGIPFLHSIPLLGKAFKYDSKSKNHKNLMLFITPTIINGREGGLPAEPQSVVPQRPNNLQPKIPQVDPNTGGLIGGVESLPNAVSYLERETDILHHTIYESRVTPDESRKLKELKIAVDQIAANCEGLLIQQPQRARQIEPYQQRVVKLQKRQQELARLLFSKKYF
jgi:type II secretory pathway component GspD/PulD (secretin)